MKEDRMIHEKVDAIFERMAVPIAWQDLRVQAGDRQLSGYLTRGPGEAAGFEVRFRQPIPGMREGAILAVPDQGRWLVLEVVEEHLGGETLFVAARVQSLDSQDRPAEGFEPLLQALLDLVATSGLGPLEREDAVEALRRLEGLASRPADPGHALRIKQRLLVLRQVLPQCPQTGTEARGLILRLEAGLRRKGLP
jgi:hypothetical protein